MGEFVEEHQNQIAHTTGFRFLRTSKLHKADEFSSVFAFRRVLRGQIFNLHYSPNTLGTPRLGVVVAKKLAKHAVSRNLIKRLAREHFRHAQANLPDLDLVIRLANAPAAYSRQALHDDLNLLFEKVRTRA